eukprot:6707898-Pyramimonas_sp.AAC.1
MASSESDNPNVWTRVDRGAGWRTTCFSDEGFRAYLESRNLALPILLSCVLGLRLECITVDVLHTMDLGVASHIIGSIMWYVSVVRNCFNVRTFDDRVGRLAKHLKEWYKTAGPG